MATQGNAKNATKEERDAIAVANQAYYSFVQTLPNGAIVQDEGVYPDYTTMVQARAEREATREEGIARAEEARDDPSPARGTVVTSTAPREGGDKPGGKG